MIPKLQQNASDNNEFNCITRFNVTHLNQVLIIFETVLHSKSTVVPIPPCIQNHHP